VVIKASSAKHIQALIADLADPDGVTREAAVARLTVIGARAVEQLIALLESNSPGSPGAPAHARAAALRALEGVGDPRALDPALDALDDPDERVSAAAASATRPFLRGVRGSVAVDRLTAVAVDTSRPGRVRAATVQTLGTLERSTLAPLWKALRDDPDPSVRALVASRASNASNISHRGTRADEALALLGDAAERELPDDPAAVRDALAHAGDAVALSRLHGIIEQVREREAAEAGAIRRGEWMRARAAAHVALANRGSRLAVYDLRESLESADAPLPVEFLAALALVGDRSCLEPIAAAYAHARDGHAWWRQHLADAFRAIAARERITRRNAVMKKVEKRWGKETLSALWTE
jgi:HEAT repeat protein